MAECVVFKRKKKGGARKAPKRVCFRRKAVTPATRASRRAALARRGRIHGSSNLRDFACKSPKVKRYPSLRKACRALGA
jgi:hypothetical protein